MFKKNIIPSKPLARFDRFRVSTKEGVQYTLSLQYYANR